MQNCNPLWTFQQSTIVPLDRTEASLTIRIITVCSLSTWHLGGNLPLLGSTRSLETNVSESLRPNYHSRVHIVLITSTSPILAQPLTSSSNNTGSFQAEINPVTWVVRIVGSDGSQAGTNARALRPA